MYATVRVYNENPDLADALVENEADVRRTIGEIEGFKAYYLIRTAEGAVSVSVFDSQSGAEQSTQAAASWMRESLPQFAGSAAPHVSAGEVAIDF